jgi:hypothetical protein
MIFKSFSEPLKDSKGSISSKRVVTITTLLLIVFCVVLDLFTKFKVSEYIFDGLMWIVLSGMGFISSERFAKK